MTALFEKGTIGKMNVINRIFMAPMGTTEEADGSYNISAINFFEKQAKGGLGFIITRANIVCTDFEERPCNELTGFHQVGRLAMLVERCHSRGKSCCPIDAQVGTDGIYRPVYPALLC